MEEKKLTTFFEQFLAKKPIFKKKQALQSNYIPSILLYRDNEIQQIANVLAPCMRAEKSSNLFVYGKSGTGKTVSVKYVSANIKELAMQKNLPIKIIYLNCKLKKIADTEYRLIAQLARKFGKTIPPTGLPTDEVYSQLYRALDSEKIMAIIILDEIDEIVKKTGDEVLYNLTRMDTELKESQVSIVGISNNIRFSQDLDPRVKSSLSEEEIIFPPYNALQIQQILKKRAETAFHEDTILSGVIEKIAALSAREHGDARRALELLRVSAEIAERKDKSKVELEDVEQAEHKIEHDKSIEITKTQPKQFQAVFYSILDISERKKESIYTGDVYELYKSVVARSGMRPLTQRRVSDVIAELDTLGMINTKTISKGRYGRTREISVNIDSTKTKIKNMLTEELGL